MSVSIQFRHVSKTFRTTQGEIEALRDVSFAVSSNNFVALIGPSGCGKSTLLHIAVALDTHYEGSCVLNPEDCQMACLFQSPRLLPWLTAEQNVAFVREAHGENRREALQAARHYLHLVNLDGFEHHFPNHLSGGMQQRVALARALAVQPDIMLMDEPFAALDEITARHMRAQLLQLQMESPCTILFVTHNITEAVFLADRVEVLSPQPGRILTEVPIDLPKPCEYDDPAIAVIARDIARYLQPD